MTYDIFNIARLRTMKQYQKYIPTIYVYAISERKVFNLLRLSYILYTIMGFDNSHKKDFG